jgi:ribose/xylose/arabinose/galactoside ABC-type transport system permease subunit
VTRFFQSSRDVSALLLVLLAAVLAVTSPYFLTNGNLDSVQTVIAPNGIIALGMMVLLICGLFDLSVGSSMGLSGIVCAILLSVGVPVTLAIIAALVFGCAFGAVNGFLVATLGVNPLIATLGTMFVGRGSVETLVAHQSLTGFTGFPESFISLGSIKVGGIYLMLWIFILLAIGIHLCITRFSWGRLIFFYGSNPEAARSYGLSTKLVVYAAYCLSGALAALAGVLMTARIEGANRYLGAGVELEIIIACLIGGASTSGGRGTVWGAVVGTILIALTRNSFNLYELPAQWQRVVLGLVLIGAVVWDAGLRAAKRRSALRLAV